MTIIFPPLQLIDRLDQWYSSLAPDKRSSQHGFTLIELLVVVAIIALLISVLLPSLNRAREQTRKSVCASQFHQVGLAFLMYIEDNDHYMPMHSLRFDDRPLWTGTMGPVPGHQQRSEHTRR